MVARRGCDTAKTSGWKPRVLAMSKIAFAATMVARMARRQSRDCPFCDSAATRLVGREKILLQMRECQHCHLRYRWPKDEPAPALAYYEGGYEGGHVTDLPDAATLAAARRNGWRGTPWDFGDKVAYVTRLASGRRLFEYGSSWGYTLDQFIAAGFDARGFEVSRPRVLYGQQNLGVVIDSTFDQLANLPDGSIDVIFTNHVLEHLPDLRPPLHLFRRLLAPAGVLIAIVPNGGGPQAVRMGAAMISREHVSSLDARFFAANLPKMGLAPRFLCEPYGDASPLSYDETTGTAGSLAGEELMVVARPVGVPGATRETLN